VVLTADRKVHAIGLDLGKATASVPIKEISVVRAWAIAPDGILAVAGRSAESSSEEDSVEIYDLGKKQNVRQLHRGREGVKVTAVGFVKGSEYLFVANSDKEVQLIAVDDPKATRTYTGFDKPIVQFCGWGDAKELVARDQAGDLYCLALSGEKKARKTTKDALFDSTPDGKTRAVLFRGNGILRVGKPTEGPPDWLFSSAIGPIDYVAFSPTREVLLTGGRRTTLKFWNADSGRLIQENVKAGLGVREIALAPDGERLAFAKPKLFTFNLTAFGSTSNENRISALGDGSPTGDCLAYSPDGKELAAIGAFGRIDVYDAAKGILTRTFERQRIAQPGGRCMAYAPNGKVLAVG
jgi:WD40 repeat protein